MNVSRRFGSALRRTLRPNYYKTLYSKHHKDTGNPFDINSDKIPHLKSYTGFFNKYNTDEKQALLKEKHELSKDFFLLVARLCNSDPITFDLKTFRGILNEKGATFAKYLLNNEQFHEKFIIASDKYNYLKKIEEGEEFFSANIGLDQNNDRYGNFLTAVQNPARANLPELYYEITSKIPHSDLLTYTDTFWSSILPDRTHTGQYESHKNSFHQNRYMDVIAHSDIPNIYFDNTIKNAAKTHKNGTFTATIMVGNNPGQSTHELACSFGFNSNGKIDRILSANSQKGANEQQSLYYFWPILKQLNGDDHQQKSLWTRFGKSIQNFFSFLPFVTEPIKKNSMLSYKLSQCIEKMKDENGDLKQPINPANWIKLKEYYLDITDNISIDNDPLLQVQGREGQCARYATILGEFMASISLYGLKGQISDKSNKEIIHAFTTILKDPQFKDHNNAQLLAAAKSVGFRNYSLQEYYKNKDKAKSSQEISTEIHQSISNATGIDINKFKFNFNIDESNIVHTKLDATNVIDQEFTKLTKAFDILENRISEICHEFDNSKSNDISKRSDYILYMTENMTKSIFKKNVLTNIKANKLAEKPGGKILENKITPLVRQQAKLNNESGKDSHQKPIDTTKFNNNKSEKNPTSYAARMSNQKPSNASDGISTKQSSIPSNM